MVAGWTKHGDGKTLAPGEVVKPDERLSWPRTVGLGAQHVVAMFGATFVFPLVMGLDPNLAIMMSGVATVMFLLHRAGRIPATWGSPSFVGGAAVIRAQGGDHAPTVTGAILVVGVVLALVGVAIHAFGARIIHRGAPAGRHRCGRHADRLQPGAGGRRASTGPRTSGWPCSPCCSPGSPSSALRGFLGPDRDLPRPGLRLRPLLGVRPDLRRDPLA